MKRTLIVYLFVLAFLLTQNHYLIPVAFAQAAQADSIIQHGFANTGGRQSKVELTVGGAVDKPLKLGAADIARLPRKTVRARDHSGKESTFEGVELIEFLKLAGVAVGEKLRGKAVSNYLVVNAVDGYRAVFAIPELDPAFTDQVILVADRRDGKPLSDDEGPLRIVVPLEKRQGR